MPSLPALRGLVLLALVSHAGLAPAQEPAADPASRPAGLAPATMPTEITLARMRREMHRADRFLLQGRFVEALEPLKFVTLVAPGHAGAWLLLSKALLGAGRPADALDAARQAVGLLERETPERRAGWGPAAFYLQLGKACAVGGDLACAETALRRADREQPRSSETVRELGSVLLRLGKDAEAATTLRTAVELDATSPRTQMELGNALMRAEDPAGAEVAFRAASALAPTEPEPWFGLASAAGARGDEAARTAALATFEKLNAERDARIEAARRVDDALRAAGEHMKASRFTEAAAGYQAVLAEPLVSEGGYKKAFVLLDLGSSLVRAGDLVAGAATLEKAVEAGPRLSAAHLELGNVLAGQGLVDEAFPHLLRATELDPLQVATHASLSMAWAALGRLDEALAESAKASLLDPEDLALREQYVGLLAASGRASDARELAVIGGIAPPGGTAPAATGSSAPAPDPDSTSGAGR